MNDKKNDTIQFLNDLWGQCSDCYISIWTTNHKHTRSFSVNEIEELVSYTKNITDDVYFTVCPRKNIQGQYKIGKTSDIKYISCFWLDIDFKSGKTNYHKKNNLPDINKNEDKKFLDYISSLIKPSYKIFTGCGYHYYWILDTPIELKNEEICYNMINLSNKFQKSFKYYFAKKNYHLDSTWDLTRVLRLPNTINTKNNTSCKIIEINLDAIYSIKEIEEFISKHSEYISIKNKIPPSLKIIQNKKTNHQKTSTTYKNQENIKIFKSPNTISKINLDSLLNNPDLIYKRCNYYKNNPQNKLEKNISCENITSPYCNNCIYKNFIKSPLELVNNVSLKQSTTTKISNSSHTEIEEKILLPLTLELFLKEAKEVFNTHEYFLISYILGFSGMLLNKNTSLKIHENWIEYPNIKIINIGSRGSKKTILMQFFSKFLDKIEKNMQKNYKKAKFYIKNASEIEDYLEYNPKGISLLVDNFEEFWTNDFDINKNFLNNKDLNTIILNIRKEDFLNNFYNQTSQFLVQDFLFFNPNFLPSGKVSYNYISETSKEIIANLFIKLANPIEEIELNLSAKSFEYFDKKISQEFFSLMHKEVDPFIIDSYYNAPSQTLKLAIIIHRIKQLLKSGYDKFISIDTLKEAKKIALISINFKKNLLINKEKSTPLQTPSIVYDYSKLSEFSIDLTRLINWIGYRRQVKNMPNWNYFTIRTLYSASVAYKKRVKDATNLLKDAEEKGIGILKENMFIVFKDVFL